MFVRRLSGGWDITDEELDALGLEQAEMQRRDAYDTAWSTYLAHLQSRDFSSAGDLLPFFVQDFFHDSVLEDFCIVGDARSVRFSCDALWVEQGDDDAPYVRFDVTFEEVVWLEVSLDEPQGNYVDYRYSEIDGLDDRIAAADEKFGPSHHSIAMETGWGGWISMVFRAVRVTPVDSALWLRLLRDPEVGTPGLFTGFEEPSASQPASA